MRDRLELIRRLLSDDGSLWITIDDNEAHYLKVLCDEVFGRECFVANVLWQKVYSDRMDAKEFSASHDHILVYKKTDRFVPKKLQIDQDDSQFNLLDSATGKRYRRRSLRKEGSNARREDRPNLWYPINAPDGSQVFPIRPATNTEGNWRWSQDTYRENAPLGIIEWVQTPRGWEVYVKQFKEEDAVRPPNTWWTSEEVGHNHEAKEEVRRFNPTNVFSTPKPERLINRILAIASNPGDVVLDSFAGSGTTGAVAQKMGRRWIMVELGEHCHTHIIPRLKKVIDGEDEGGITKAVDWKGGGGFRYYHIAPTLIEKDAFDMPIISKQFNPAMLAEAMCKIMGFQYAPADLYWQQGCSTETDFIYVTTQTLTRDHLAALSDEVGKKRSLLVCCAAFRGKADAFPNLTLKKIPLAVLQKCEWGHDDYSLNVANLPQAPEPVSAQIAGAAPLEPKQARKRRARTETMPSLFDGGAE
jgi:adenine-specific DNA-methyltransferase